MIRTAIVDILLCSLLAACGQRNERAMTPASGTTMPNDSERTSGAATASDAPGRTNVGIDSSPPSGPDTTSRRSGTGTARDTVSGAAASGGSQGAGAAGDAERTGSEGAGP